MNEFNQALDKQRIIDKKLRFAEKIQVFVERLAAFRKEKELKGVAKIFFKNGCLLLKLILYKCKVDITYGLIQQGMSTQVIVITSTVGGATGFVLAWNSVGATLIATPVLLATLGVRSVIQQLIAERDYLKVKKILERVLEDKKIQETIHIVFEKGDVPTTSLVNMKPSHYN